MIGCVRSPTVREGKRRCLRSSKVKASSIALPIDHPTRDARVGTPVGRASDTGGLLHLLFEILIELFRLVLRHAQALPIARLEMFCEIDDLPDVISIVSQLPINGLHDRMILAANFECAQ